MYDEILLPTDSSPGAEAAVEHALHLARQNDAVLHVLHVTDVSEFEDLTDDQDTGAEIDEEAKELLDPVLTASEEAGVETIARSVNGTPHKEVVDYIEANDIDLVVMGTHGKTGISRVLLGSTAEKVVRNSPAPVLTVGVEQ